MAVRRAFQARQGFVVFKHQFIDARPIDIGKSRGSIANSIEEGVLQATVSQRRRVGRVAEHDQHVLGDISVRIALHQMLLHLLLEIEALVADARLNFMMIVCRHF